MYTIDTNVIIYFLKDEPAIVKLFREIFRDESSVYISSITEVELFSFQNLNPSEIQLISNFLDTISIIPIDSRIARLSGFLRRNYNLKLPDGVIAATALFTKTTLLTRNIKDFRGIPNLLVQRV